MASTRAEFNALIEERTKRKAFAQKAELRQLVQSTVPIKSLTQSAEWNYYLSLIQTKIEELGGILAALQESQTLDPSFTHEGLASYKAQMMRVAEQKRTLEQVIDLPAKILQEGEKAQFALRSVEDA